MNTNEQQTKTLGHTLFDAMKKGFERWELNKDCHERFEQWASSVEAAVLSRLGGEWMKLPDGSILKKGEEEYKANVGWELFLCRRIQPSPTPEVHVATESSAGRLEQEECPSCGGSGDKYHGPYKIVSESCPTCNGIGILSCDTQRSTRRPLPQPPATPSGETTLPQWELGKSGTLRFQNRHVAVLANLAEDDAFNLLSNLNSYGEFKQEISTLREQLQQVTKERDEALVFYCKDSKEWRSRAETAEKRLSEVERELEEVRPFRDAALNPFNAIKDAK